MIKNEPKSRFHHILIEPNGVSVRVEHGANLGDMLGQANIPQRFECGGRGQCGKCRVVCDPPENLSPMTQEEREHLPQQRIAEGFRLACRATVLGNLTVTIPEALTENGDLSAKNDISGAFEPDPAVERLFLPKSPNVDTARGVPDSLSDRLEKRIKAARGHGIEFDNPDVLRQTALLDTGAEAITLVLHKRKGVTAILPGSRENRLGVAVDIGTTTVAAYLCNLETGEVMTAASAVNPQRRHGEDVISRIAFAAEQASGLKILQKQVVETVNALIGRCTRATGTAVEDIDEVSIVGNTTMEQIFAGFHPRSIGVAPYLPVTRAYPDLRAADLGLDLNPGTPIYVFPVLSGFIGGDTLGAVLSEAPHEREQITLIVDIGTNGELVLGNQNGLWATSCATGPALEGAGISQGMRAVAGAIHKVEADPDGNIRCHVMGDKETRPLGICGSGIIDAAAVLRKTGILLPHGRFDDTRAGVVCDEKGIGRKVILVEENNTPGTEIAVTLKDVRQVQLAKAALSAGITLLMQKAGVEQIHRTVLTGAFGARFDRRNAAAIGMLPQEAVAGEVVAMDNLAGKGAIMALLNDGKRAEVDRFLNRMRFMELAGEPDFAADFVKATLFP